MNESETIHIQKRFEEIYGNIVGSDSITPKIKEAVRMAFFAGYRTCQNDVMKIYLEDI